jgi:hypothetical protein
LTTGTLQRIREAAASGELLNKRHLLHNLFRWRDFAGGGDEVRTWIDSRLGEDAFVLRMMDAITSTSWVSNIGIDGMGDRVSRGVPNVQLDGLESILDVNRFLARTAEVEGSLTGDWERQVVGRFREGVRRRDEQQARRQPADPANGVEPDLETEVFADAMIDDENASASKANEG